MFKGKDGTVIVDISTWRRKLVQDYEGQWAKLMPTMPPLRNYLSHTRGFNLNEFIWKVGASPETGKNWREVVVAQYGQPALALIEFLRDSAEKPGRSYGPVHIGTQSPPAQSGVASLFAPVPVVQPAANGSVAGLFGTTAPAQIEPEAPATDISSLFK